MAHPLPLFHVLLVGVLMLCSTGTREASAQDDHVSLFNGRDLSGWIVPEGDNGHWHVESGVIDYDAMSEADGDKNLWTEAEYGDFELKLDWRLKDVPFVNPNVPIIRPDGTHQRNADGTVIRMAVPDADSGIFLRGSPKAQVNIWAWPIGSGEVYGYRMDPSMPPEVVAGVTPSTMADNHIGEWNTFVIRMEGEYLTVMLNDVIVINNARLPEVPERGRIALQHHGHKVDGEWASSPSLVQFRNISIREL
ncbi:MAG: 3-keto-disaccharide hydrolase [Bacteroidota bacterium]